MNVEDLLEEFQNVRYRMDAEGFHYCFDSYSSFTEVEDEKFHQLRMAYLESAKKLQEYVDLRIEQLEEQIN